jgi:hypothetical protein
LIIILRGAGLAAAGPVVYDGQSRTLRADLSEQFPTGGDDIPVGDSQSAAAPDFGPWDASVTARIADPPVPGDFNGHGTVSQHSTLTDAAITAAGTGSVLTDTIDGSAGIHVGVDVTFTLDAARDFSLDFFFTANELGHGFADVKLNRVGGATLFEADPDFDRDDTVDGVIGRGAGRGTLQPGQYRFLVNFSTGGAIGEDNLDYSVSLDLTPDGPEPGPTPVPLPPAAWPAQAPAGAVAAINRLRRRA